MIFPVKKFVWLTAVATLLALALSACNKKGEPAPEADEILIGEYGSMTGGTATFGQSNHKGVEMAVDEANAAGGILGKKVRLLLEDDQGKPEEAMIAVTKLINKDRVVAVIGEVASSNSLAAGPVCQQNRIPMVSGSSTNPKVTEVGNYIFRVCFIDPFQGKVMAKFAFNSLKVKNVAVLRDVKTDYSVGLANVFVKEFTAMGGTIVADESYSQGDKDFSAQLTTLKGKKPDAIFLPGYYTEVGLVARQAHKFGITVPLLGGDGWDSEKLWDIGGEALNGCFFSNHTAMDDPSPAIQNFVAAYKQRFGGQPDALAALGHDAAALLLDAIRRAGSAHPDSIREALEKTKDFAGAAGVINFDADRNAVKSAVVLEVRDGKYVYKETVTP